MGGERRGGDLKVMGGAREYRGKGAPGTEVVL